MMYAGAVQVETDFEPIWQQILHALGHSYETWPIQTVVVLLFIVCCVWWAISESADKE